MLNSQQRKELSHYKLMVLVSAFGLTASMNATMFYSLGVFIPQLENQFGWSRGDISLGATFLTVAMFISGTNVGRLCDRFGAARVGAISFITFALAVVYMALGVANLYQFWLAYFLIAVLGIGTSPIVLVRPIITHLHYARGFAMGIALTGAGIAGFWVPQVMTFFVEAYNWRIAYLFIAALALVSAPVVWFGMRSASGEIAEDKQAAIEGVTHAAARRTVTYWLLTLMALAMACAVAGMIVHLVPLLIDRGATATQAAGIASTLGITSVVGRLTVGYLIDRTSVVRLTAVILLLASVSVLVLAHFGLGWSYVAVAMLGLAAGAEVDLIAILTVGYFGRRYYSAIYGWLFSVFCLGYGIGPYIVGRLFDRFESYSVSLLFSASLMAVAIIITVSLPKVTYPSTSHS